MQAECRVCGSTQSIKLHDLYPFGSEGVLLCQQCEIAICNMIRDMASACNRRHLIEHRKHAKAGRDDDAVHG